MNNNDLEHSIVSRLYKIRFDVDARQKHFSFLFDNLKSGTGAYCVMVGLACAIRKSH